MHSSYEEFIDNYFKCPYCSTSYSYTGLIELDHMSKADPSEGHHKLAHARCRNCERDFYYYLASDLYPIWVKNPMEPIVFTPSHPPDFAIPPQDPSEGINRPDLEGPPFDPPIPELPDFLLNNDPATEPKEDEPGKMAEFQRVINEIDKTLPTPELFKRISEALDIIITEPPPQIEAGYALLQERFRLTARTIEAFRKDVNHRREVLEKDKAMEQIQAVFSQISQPPKELMEDERQEAIDYLKNPDLFKNISRDIATAGEVIGEETNKMMLYLAATSRKFKKPISLVIFGKSSSGKSHLANAIEQFMPGEETLVLSSMTAKALEYMGDQLRHKLLVVQEWEGLTEALPTLRTLQSEGKLARLHTAVDPVQKKRVARSDTQECPCSVIVTTTKEGIHDENSTRIFELYADESVEQTEKVVRLTLMKSDTKNRISQEEKDRIFQLHQNVQRILEPVYVNIPYASHLSFPAKTTRHRRDSERFVKLIKTVAFLRQRQKEMIEKNGMKHIDADMEDYRIAYEIGLDIMRSTLNSISDRAKNALIACCELNDRYVADHKDPMFSVTEIQVIAQELGLDFGNRQDLYKQLDKLEEYEYLERNQAYKNSTKHYRVCFAYERDDAGEIINIDAPDVKEILTPEELSEKIEKQYKSLAPSSVGPVNTSFRKTAKWMNLEKPAIISVSRRTDIPAFYGDWFMNCLERRFAGYLNPFGGTKHLVSLRPENVACFVFWSKNFEPFMEHLKTLKSRGYNCYFHFTITGLPKSFEPNVIEIDRALDVFREISQMFSPEQINWRYDPIVFSEKTNADFHIDTFLKIVWELKGFTNRCYFSYPTLYGKVERNINKFQKEENIEIFDPDEEYKINLANRLADIALSYDITMHSCCGEYLVGERIQKAHCVDGDLISQLFFSGNNEFKPNPSRESCGCAQSYDIGAYDTCKNGCFYCYANVNKDKAQMSFEKHDPLSVFLGSSSEESNKWVKESEMSEPSVDKSI